MDYNFRNYQDLVGLEVVDGSIDFDMVWGFDFPDTIHTVNGNVFISDGVFSLPDNLTINGDVDISVYNEKIKKLPDNLTVTGKLDIGNKLCELGKNLKVGGELRLYCTDVSEIKYPIDCKLFNCQTNKKLKVLKNINAETIKFCLDFVDKIDYSCTASDYEVFNLSDGVVEHLSSSELFKKYPELEAPLPDFDESLNHNFILNKGRKEMNLLERLQILTESKNINYLIKRFPKVKEHEIKDLIGLDPTWGRSYDDIGKFSEWIISQYAKGNITKDNKLAVEELLVDFTGMLKQKDRLTGDERSISYYKTVDDLRNALEEAKKRGASENVKGTGSAKMLKPIEDADIVYADDQWTVYTPYTFNASRACASIGGDRASWCTSYNDHYWKTYSKTGPIYIVADNAGNQAWHQFDVNYKDGHVSLNGHMDRQDRPFNMQEFLDENPGLKNWYENDVMKATPEEQRDYFRKLNGAEYEALVRRGYWEPTQSTGYGSSGQRRFTAQIIEEMGYNTLPDNFEIRGDMVLQNASEFVMPKNLTVTGTLQILDGCPQITSIDNLSCEKLILIRSDVREIGDNVEVDTIITPDGQYGLRTTEKTTAVAKFRRWVEREAQAVAS